MSTLAQGLKWYPCETKDENEIAVTGVACLEMDEEKVKAYNASPSGRKETFRIDKSTGKERLMHKRKPIYHAFSV